eukprot:2657006-Ditylum_brightwellii.AAC.1
MINSYYSDYGGGHDRDFRDAPNNRYSDSYATDSRRNIVSDAPRFGGYSEEPLDRRGEACSGVEGFKFVDIYTVFS